MHGPQSWFIHDLKEISTMRCPTLIGVATDRGAYTPRLVALGRAATADTRRW